MSDVPLTRPRKKASSRLAVICLVFGMLICFASLLVPHWELQGPILTGAASEKEHVWYFVCYTLPGVLGLIALVEAYRVRYRDPEGANHVDDATPIAMAMAALLVAYSTVDSLLFLAF